MAKNEIQNAAFHIPKGAFCAFFPIFDSASTSSISSIQFLKVSIWLIPDSKANTRIEIITTEPQGGRYPGVKQPIAEVTHIEKPDEAIGSFSQNCDMILVIGSLYLCGNILTFLQLDSDDNLDILSSIGDP